MESITTDEIFETAKHLMAEEQQDFFRRRSTTTNLAVFGDFLSNNIEAGDLSILVDWSNRSYLELNITKCKVMRFFKCYEAIL
ncbi:hypothetical protein ILUMI_02242 [Ignelater luminosus]|uniref:Uncharacterized protein n=1 Tax=Ignelater luminosus TaxID=2038154 RepID=A0A8K0DGV6_IGNLU|nr:hypothetical protein ILUMI_02242 [Ignelater luminosus]